MTLRDLLNKILWQTGHKLVKIGGNTLGGVDWMVDTKVLLDPKRNPVCVDVGVNYGQTTTALLDLFPDAKVFGFEPAPELFVKVQKRFANNSSVTLFPCALGDVSDRRVLNVYEHAGANTLLAPDQNRQKVTDLSAPDPVVAQPEVAVETLDHCLAKYNLAAIDLLKIDVQGYELKVLKGAAELLNRHAIRLILTEVLFVSAREEQPTLADLYNYLAPFGFRLAGFYNRNYTGKTFTFCDVLWERV